MLSIKMKTASIGRIHRQPGGPEGRPPITALPHAAANSPVRWWRTRGPLSFSRKDLAPLRRCLIRTTIIAEPEWIEAATGDAVSAIAVGIRLLHSQVIGAAEIDLALSSVLACAIEGDATSPILISSALRRRSKVDPACRRLSELWLDARF
ncbi:hypothetical protein SAMN05216374_2798 [Tardiphaga sp. OK246]|uniref:hypothetical protein n=1 Tax=Tardiphaga sp. OK246 TaxID=1855307 RepID=UPI000B756EE1|nr:hypothetical protein [Tardiphaga sp. OK246]SNT12469.1 hypothetical protein SAMN05216374_2798 [Tardiphaga sp. OK246]